MEIMEYEQAQLIAEADERFANRGRELAEQELVRLKDLCEPELLLLEKPLLHKMKNAMKTRTLITVDAGGLSFERLICMNFNHMFCPEAF